MGRLAILVDAGYLLMAAGELVAGKPVKRHAISLSADEVVLALLEVASMCEPADELLRLYWYDAAISPERLTTEQAAIAAKRNCKLRLGTLNAVGVQKGVDTLMVMDLLTLSQNKAVDSVVVVTGDDDLRLAVEAAQAHGVRAHLLGIAGLPGARNQSERLLREFDSTREWRAEDVADFVSVSAELAPPPLAAAANDQAASQSANDALAEAIEHALQQATDDDRREIMEKSSVEFAFVPQHIDRRLLGRYGANLDRTLGEEEKRVMRRALYEKVAATRAR